EYAMLAARSCGADPLSRRAVPPAAAKHRLVTVIPRLVTVPPARTAPAPAPGSWAAARRKHRLVTVAPTPAAPPRPPARTLSAERRALPLPLLFGRGQ